MMKADLAQARATWIEEAKDDAEEYAVRQRSDFLKYKDRLGKVADLHSLRHRYVTELARAGVPITLAKELARHSDVRLTAAVYSHVDLSEKAAAVNGLAFSSVNLNATTNNTYHASAPRIIAGCHIHGREGVNMAPD